MIVNRVRLSRTARDQLVRLKRRTRIQTWHVLCRWALCVSLAEPSKPQNVEIPTDSNLEIDWKTFSGSYGNVIEALVRTRCIEDGLGIEHETIVKQFKLHLHRGISYLAGKKQITSLEKFVQVSMEISNMGVTV